MRITLLLRILWTAGAQRIAISEARELQALGHKVRVVFLRGSDFKGYEALLKGLDYEVISDSGVGLLTPVYDLVTRAFMPGRGAESRVDYNLIRSFPGYLRENPTDLVLCHDQWAGLAGFYANKRLGTTYRVMLHEKLSSYTVPLLGPVAGFVEANVLRAANRVFAITPRIARTAIDRLGINAIGNYPGMDRVKSTAFSKKEKALLSVSMWDIGRQPFQYLEVLRELEDFHLYFAGNWRSDELRQQFERRVDESGLRSRVSILPGIPEDRLRELYDRSLFLLRFGFQEYGVATSTVEAIAYGVPPVITSDIGVAELVSRYECGCVLHGQNARLAASCIRGIDNEPAFARMQEGLSRLSSDYTWNRHCLTLLGNATSMA